MDSDRAALVRRGLRLNDLTIGYNVLEALVSLAAGLVSGSTALVGFGIDSAIEVTASGAARWRLRADLDAARRDRIERTTRRIVAWCFLALAGYIIYDGIRSLVLGDHAESSPVGVALLTLSVIVMPILARAKRRVAYALRSETLRGESRQTSLCGYLSAIGLAGVACNTLAGWSWADPLAALAMVPIIVKEGAEALAKRPEDA